MKGAAFQPWLRGSIDGIPPAQIRALVSLRDLFRQPAVRRRVSVKVSARDPDLLVVRPLADGEAAPAGAHEAFLVMVDR